MQRRKIQLVAGMTYAVSLPKEWIKKNNLKAKEEVIVNEEDNGNLIITKEIRVAKGREKISINVEDYKENVDQVLFELYYLGFETIELFSRENISKETKSQIRKTLTNMSGTEITYEDLTKISIKILLDKSRVNVIQSLYRICLIIDQSLTNLEEKLDYEEMEINEAEIDRLYHLIMKILSLSLHDTSLLKTSGVENSQAIMSYILIAKKLENLADNIFYIARHLHKNKEKKLAGMHEIIDIIKKELDRSIHHILKGYPNMFNRTEYDRPLTREKIKNIKNEKIKEYISYSFRYLIDIEEEVVSISFYKKLLRDKMI